MSDGGKHFDNNEVRETCTKWGTTTRIVPAYSPWINGLVEGTNKILLHVLKRLCTPELGEDEEENNKPENTPRNWPEHLDEAVQILNSRLLPTLKFSPKELLFGLVVNTPPTAINTTLEPVTTDDVAVQMAYVAQQRLDGYVEMVAHAIKRKSMFDKRVLAHKPGEVIFHKGQLVQIYISDLDFTLKTDRKLLPKWSPPQRIVSRNLNSYTLEKLDGTPISSLFSARRLREFIPRDGTKLAQEQADLEQQDGVQELQGGGVDNRTQDDEDAGQTTGDEDAATEEGGHME